MGQIGLAVSYVWGATSVIYGTPFINLTRGVIAEIPAPLEKITKRANRALEIKPNLEITGCEKSRIHRARYITRPDNRAMGLFRRRDIPSQKTRPCRINDPTHSSNATPKRAHTVRNAIFSAGQMARLNTG